MVKERIGEEREGMKGSGRGVERKNQSGTEVRGTGDSTNSIRDSINSLIETL